jgi:6-phosphogluconolactonase
MKLKLIYLGIFMFAITSCKNTDSQENAGYNSEAYEAVFIGTYTKKEGHVDGKATGIYILKMDKKTGELSLVNVIRDIVNPSYLTIHPNKKWMYAVQELADGNRIGKVSAYSFDKEMNVSELNQVSSKGDAPCHISVDKTGKYVLVANYMETIAAYPIQEDGSLGEASSVVEHQRTQPKEVRQETGHPHKINAVLNDNTILVTDLGLDQVLHYQLDKEGVLNKVVVTPTAFKAGPRHFDVHTNQKWMYVLNELNATIEAFNIENGQIAFERFQTIGTLAEPSKDNYPSAIHIHPNGKLLYSANRGLNGSKEQSISMFSIHPETGQLTFKGTQNTKGNIPRDFAIDPSGQYLLAANQNSDNIITFKINTETGMLEETGLEFAVNTPVCLKFL